MKFSKAKNKFVGYIPAAFSILISCFWAGWGIIENFHEGWYQETLIENLLVMAAQYLSPMLVSIAVSVVAIKHHKAGALLHFALAVFSLWFFRGGNPATVIIISGAFVVVGVFYWYRSVDHKRITTILAIFLPLLTIVAAGATPFKRVMERTSLVNHSSCAVHQNGLDLLWAPAGPGWPQNGTDWYNAQEVCGHLGASGESIEKHSIGVWRLPTVEEAVRSMALHGQNSRGVWNANNQSASYSLRPDKEAPLWDIYSPVIYMWTGTDVDDDTAYMIAYDGQVWKRKKGTSQTYLAFRCVRDVKGIIE